jgi:formylmethanofuran dehydrogenase subunit D
VVVSGFQPVVVPYYNTHATADVLLSAVQGIGGTLGSALPYKDEVEYIQNNLSSLVTEDGYINAPEIKTFMGYFQQYGGWWSAQPGLANPDASNALNLDGSIPPASFDGTGEYYLYPFMSPILGDGSGANKPWLQETPDPTTTVMWNSWVEIHPETAHELGIENDDVVKIISPIGEIEVSVYLYPAIEPHTIAIPFGQGHTVYGRYAQGRGVNPIHLVSPIYNGADDLAYGATKVKIEKTGRKKVISRLESLMGVYGEGLGE